MISKKKYNTYRPKSIGSESNYYKKTVDSHMEQDHRTPIEKIILPYRDVFTLPGGPLPCTNFASHKIVIKEAKVINNRSYKPPECHRQEINN